MAWEMALTWGSVYYGPEMINTTCYSLPFDNVHLDSGAAAYI